MQGTCLNGKQTRKLDTSYSEWAVLLSFLKTEKICTAVTFKEYTSKIQLQTSILA